MLVMLPRGSVGHVGFGAIMCFSFSSSIYIDSQQELNVEELADSRIASAFPHQTCFFVDRTIDNGVPNKKKFISTRLSLAIGS